GAWSVGAIVEERSRPSEPAHPPAEYLAHSKPPGSCSSASCLTWNPPAESGTNFCASELQGVFVFLVRGLLICPGQVPRRDPCKSAAGRSRRVRSAALDPSECGSDVAGFYCDQALRRPWPRYIQ